MYDDEENDQLPDYLEAAADYVIDDDDVFAETARGYGSYAKDEDEDDEADEGEDSERYK